MVSPRANQIGERSMMGAVELVTELRRRSLGKSLGQDAFDGYEQRLIRWGCSRCRYFEKRVFSTGLRSKELDAYMICRFDREPVDLIAEADACPKNCKPELHEKRSKARQRRLHKGNSALKITVAA